MGEGNIMVTLRHPNYIKSTCARRGHWFVATIWDVDATGRPRALATERASTRFGALRAALFTYYAMRVTARQLIRG